MDKDKLFSVKIAAVMIAVAALTAFVYLPALSAGFINWDDPANLIDNTLIRSLKIPGLKSIFTTFHDGNYIPFTWLSHAVVFRFARLDPAAHHLVNVALHAVNASLVFLLFFVIMRIIYSRNGRTSGAGFFYIAAAIGATAWGIHPTHVESVVWVSERKDLGCAFFFLLGILAYIRYASSGRHRYGALAVSYIFFIFSLLFKAMSVTLPVILLLIDRWVVGRMQGEREIKGAIFEKAPFFLASILAGIAAFMSQLSSRAVISMQVAPLIFRLMNAFRSLVFYIEKTALPINLSPFYPIMYPESNTFLPANIISMVIVIFVSVILCRGRGRRPYGLLFAAWSFYVITLLPVLGIIQVGTQRAADRYTYLPSLGLMLAGSFAILWVWDKLNSRPAAARGIFHAAVIAILVMLAAASRDQIKVWKDSFSFWNYINNKSGVINAVYVRSAEDDPAARPSSTDHPYVHDGLGCAYLEKGSYDEAIPEFKKAIELDSGYELARLNLWYAYFRKNDTDNAFAIISEAIKLNPNNAKSYSNLGITYAQKGLYKKSEEAFLKALSMAPSNYEYISNLASLRRLEGDLDKAIDLYGQAVELSDGEPKYVKLLSETMILKENSKAGRQ